MLTQIAFSFFCALALAAPDRSLLAKDATIAVPFAHVDVSYVSFLVVGPVVAVAIAVYLQVFVDRWAALGGRTRQSRVPYLFNLSGALPRLLSSLLVDWLAVILLWGFAWKSLPRQNVAPGLIAAAFASSAVVLWLQIRRCPDESRRFNRLRWVSLLGVAGLAVVLLGGAPMSRRLDLTEQNLDREDLRWINLTSSILDRTSFSGANLEGAALSNVRASGTVFDHANLFDSNLHDSRFAGASFQGADLRCADLQGTDLHDATGLSAEMLARATVNKQTHLPKELEALVAKALNRPTNKGEIAPIKEPGPKCPVHAPAAPVFISPS